MYNNPLYNIDRNTEIKDKTNTKKKTINVFQSCYFFVM